VHGANNNFYRTVGQAAQYRHFTGRHTAVVSFVWPSLENIIRYGGDVKNAKISAPLLTDLLELLALHTEARYINVLGYSLGAQVVSNALNELRQRYADQDPVTTKDVLRIGEVYYAAADVDFQKFVEQFYFYSDIVGRVSLTINLQDSALGVSQIMQGVSRAGRPDTGELNAEQTQWLLEASNSEVFDVLEVGPAIAPYEAFSAHDYWYNNPRVSTDVLIQMLSHAPPEQRGLDKFISEKGYEVWTFPDNYQERALEAVRALREASKQAP
jgi:esterase/lipase superfamily enzyme